METSLTTEDVAGATVLSEIDGIAIRAVVVVDYLTPDGVRGLRVAHTTATSWELEGMIRQCLRGMDDVVWTYTGEDEPTDAEG